MSRMLDVGEIDQFCYVFPLLIRRQRVLLSLSLGVVAVAPVVVVVVVLVVSRSILMERRTMSMVMFAQIDPFARAETRSRSVADLRHCFYFPARSLG